MAGNKKRKKSHKKHCNSKRDVFQLVQNQIEEKQPQRRGNNLGQQLQTINQLKPVIEAAKNKMRVQEGKDNDSPADN